MRVHPATSASVYQIAGAPAQAWSPARARTGGAWATVCAAIGALGLAALATGAIAARDEATARIPALAPFYRAIGLPVAAQGATLGKLSATLDENGADHVLMVDSEIGNAGTVAAQVPALRVSIIGADGREIYHWDAAPPKASLAPKETIAFRARLAAPPAEGRRVQLRFVAPSDSQPWLNAR